MDEAVKDIPESKEMITVPEAYLLFLVLARKLFTARFRKETLPVSMQVNE